MITEAESMLLMMHGRETACIFHNAYFDIAVMICSAELKAAGFINRLSIKRAAVSLHAAAYVPTYAWQTLRKLLLTSKERKAMHSVLWGDAEQYLLKNKPKNSYKLLCEQKKKKKSMVKSCCCFCWTRTTVILWCFLKNLPFTGYFKRIPLL